MNILQRIRTMFGGRSGSPRRAPAGVERTIDVTKLRGFYSQLGYQSAITAIRDGRIATPGAGDIHQRYAREQLVNQARAFKRDNILFGGMIDRATSYIMGNGYGLQAKTENPEWNAKAEAWWRDVFWKRPELTGLMCGRMVEEMICKELLTCGDVGVIFTDKQKLQLIESEQIKGKDRNSDGLVREEGTGTVTGFWVTQYKNGMADPTTAKEFKPSEFLFISRPDRPSSVRAVPPCQAAFTLLHRINDVCDSEAIAWQLLARLAISHNRPGGAAGMFQLSEEDKEKQNKETAQLTTRVTDFDYGIVVSGEPGDEIKGIDRNIPGQNFAQSLTMYLRLLGLSLGLPLEITLLDWTKSNYSQSRAVLEQAYVTFIAWQLLIEESFHQPVYRWAINLAIEAKILPRLEGDDMYAHEWIKPSFPWIDQLAEAEAKGAMIDRSFTTLGSVLKTLNKDLDEVMAARKREIILAMKTADEITKEMGKPCAWEPLAGLQYSVNKPKDQAKEDSTQKKDPPAEDKNEEDKNASASAAPPVFNITVKTQGPSKTVSRCTKRDEKGRSEEFVQEHEYSKVPE